MSFTQAVVVPDAPLSYSLWHDIGGLVSGDPAPDIRFSVHQELSPLKRLTVEWSYTCSRIAKQPVSGGVAHTR